MADTNYLDQTPLSDKENQPQIPITTFDSVSDPSGKDGRTITWPEFVKVLQRAATVEYPNKKSAQLFSPTIYEQTIQWNDEKGEWYKGFRCRKNVISAGMLAIDYDEGLAFQEAKEKLEQAGIESVLYTTASNRTGDRFRVVVPLAQPIGLAEYGRALAAFCHFLSPDKHPDSTKLNPDCLFYWPGQYRGADNRIEHIQGDILSAAEWQELSPVPPQAERPIPSPIQRPKPSLSHGVVWSPEECKTVHAYRSLGDGRHKRLYGLMLAVAMSAYTNGYDLSEFELADFISGEQSSNRPRGGGYSEEQIRDKVAQAIRQAPYEVTNPIFEAKAERDKWKEPYRGQVQSLADMIADLNAKPPEYDNEFIDKIVEEDEVPKEWRFYTREECRYIPPPSWTVKGLLPDNAHIGLYGESGTMKSFIALDIGMSLAMALKAFGEFETFGGGKPVIYFAGEGFHDIAKKRQTAWEIHRDIEPYSTKNFYTFPRVPFSNSPEEVKIGLDTIKKHILKGQPLGVCIIDTLSRALNGADEDKSYSATQYFTMLDEIKEQLGANITITVGHFGKDLLRGERGSSNFRASYDTIIWVEYHIKDEETKQHTLQLYVRKQKGTDDGLRIWLQSRKVDMPTENGGDAELSNSLVLVPISEVEGRAALMPAAKREKADEKVSFANEVEFALSIIAQGGSHVSQTKVAEHFANKNKGPKTTEEQYRKLVEKYRAQLKRGAEDGSLKQFVRSENDNSRWGLPRSTVHREQANETNQMIRDIMAKSGAENDDY